ncbi:GNAT family N-acetyltransferase [Changchengzhania lutea]|uniref:GNAT family N-acetyltransferase n=1 Tax=Changchengzhania lutea TaxID=2049305 RepID=UPI00115F364C|nr:GNAT family N-acetyltransferase [Changchengzhania lutea]
MEVKQKDTDKRGRFYVGIDGVEKAIMTYSRAGQDKIIIDHTEVDESLRGEGIGYKLVEASVKYARANNLKIMPLCPFANAIFKKNSEYADVLF